MMKDDGRVNARIVRYSTREIVDDAVRSTPDERGFGRRKLGHNPSWVKAFDHDAYVVDVSARLQQLERELASAKRGCKMETVVAPDGSPVAAPCAIEGCQYDALEQARAALAEWQPLNEVIADMRVQWLYYQDKGDDQVADQIAEWIDALTGVISSDQPAPNPAALGSTTGSAPSSVAGPIEQPIPAPWTPDESPDRQ